MSQSAPNSKPLVVVVDDSAAVRTFFERLADELNVEVRSADSAGEAERVLDACQPALVFLDIIMPDKDGLTFLQELRKDPKHVVTPVIIISSKDYAQDKIVAKDLGAVDFLAKPITAQTVRQMIEQHLC